MKPIDWQRLYPNARTYGEQMPTREYYTLYTTYGGFPICAYRNQPKLAQHYVALFGGDSAPWVYPEDLTGEETVSDV